MDRAPGFKLCLVLNKVDRVEPKRLLIPLTEKICSLVDFDEVFMISALEDDGVDDIRVIIFILLSWNSKQLFVALFKV